MNPGIQWKGEKLLPIGMKALIESNIPPEVVTDGLHFIVHGKVPSVEKTLQAFAVYRRGEPPEIHIFLWRILFHKLIEGKGSRQYRAWKGILDVALHEIGHAATREDIAHIPHEVYLERGREYHHIEDLANKWRDTAIEAIVKEDPRVGQPEEWIGGLPGVYLSPFLKTHPGEPQWSSASLARINDYRAYQCGGQFTLTDAIGDIKSKMPIGIGREGILRDFIKREAPALGITRHYVDGAGRKHLFFNYGELLKVADHVLVSPKFFTKVTSPGKVTPARVRTDRGNTDSTFEETMPWECC